MASDPVGRVALSVCRRLTGTARGRRIADTLLSDDDVATWIEHRLGTRATREAPAMGEVAPKGPPSGFEDLMWLFTPTYAARGLSELLLDEAAYLYRLLMGLDEPRVV